MEKCDAGSLLLLQCLSHYPLYTHVCIPLAHFSSCIYMSDSLFTGLFGFKSLWFCRSVNLIGCFLAVKALCMNAGCLELDTVFWVCAWNSGVACPCYLSLCVLLWFGIVCLCFCLDYYGMQLAAEPLPVYCPHPGPGIITDITRLFTVWEPR